jgi:hypothetical protein
MRKKTAQRLHDIEARLRYTAQRLHDIEARLRYSTSADMLEKMRYRIERLERKISSLTYYFIITFTKNLSVRAREEKEKK